MYNSPLLIHDEARRLEEMVVENKNSLAEDLLKFVARVEDFNLRCVAAGGVFADLTWNMSRVLDHVNRRLIPEHRGNYRADF